MAMEIALVIEDAHDSPITCMTYNRVKKELYTAAEGDKSIKVWDIKTGAFLRPQTGHKGWVTCLTYAVDVKLLFSGSVDGTIAVWTDRGDILQNVNHPGGAVFCLAWYSKRRVVVSGGHSVLNVFRLDLLDVQKLRLARRAQQHDVGPGSTQDQGQILKKVVAPLRGPELGHTDVVRTIIVTDAAKIVTGGYDKCICFYDYEKLESFNASKGLKLDDQHDKLTDAFQKIKNVHHAGVQSMAYDSYNNCILTGSIDGSLRVWSMEGRCLDKFDNINDQPTCTVYVPCTNMYWVTGRFNRVMAFDPRAPANLTDFTHEPNCLWEHNVDLLYVPPRTDLVLGATRHRQVLVWQYNHSAAYRVFSRHDDWTEGLLVVKMKDMQEHIWSYGADGMVLHWMLDAEQNCDVYQCIEEIQLHERNIYCMVYSKELDCIVTGGEDQTIQVHYMDGKVPKVGEHQLPTSFTDHEGRVTGLVLLKDNILASVSADKTLRIWDLSTMKLLQTKRAHNASVQCIENCEERNQLATCGCGNKVKIWDVSNPQQPKVVLILNHAESTDHADDDDLVDDAANGRRRSDMVWLTTSKLNNLNKPKKQDLVSDAVKNASKGWPEVTQISWASFKQCWVTAADDEVIRLWNTTGDKILSFPYTGGSVQCLFVDSINQMLLVSTLDKNTTLYDLDEPLPKARFSGHKDVVKGIAYIENLDFYVTASWDRTLRLWFRPDGKHTNPAVTTAVKEEVMEDYFVFEDRTHTYVSDWEAKHPLTVPKALMQDISLELRAIGLWDDQSTAPERKKQRSKNREVVEVQEEVEDLTSIHLGAKLQDLEKALRGRLDAQHSSNLQQQMQPPAAAAPAVAPAAPTRREHEDSMLISFRKPRAS